MWQKLIKAGKIWQVKPMLIFPFASFLGTVAKKSFLEERMDTKLCPNSVLRFS